MSHRPVGWDSGNASATTTARPCYEGGSRRKLATEPTDQGSGVQFNRVHLEEVTHHARSVVSGNSDNFLISHEQVGVARRTNCEIASAKWTPSWQSDKVENGYQPCLGDRIDSDTMDPGFHS
jgi:hypothetical protein